MMVDPRAEGLSPDELAEIERRKAEIEAGEIGGVVLDPEDEAEHFRRAREIDELDRRGELISAEQYLAESRAEREQARRRAG